MISRLLQFLTCCIKITKKATQTKANHQVSEITSPLQDSWVSLVAQLVRNLPAMRETWVRSLGWEAPLVKGKATLSSTLAWRIPWICIVHGVAKSLTKSQAWLSDLHLHFSSSWSLPSHQPLPLHSYSKALHWGLQIHIKSFPRVSPAQAGWKLVFCSGAGRSKKGLGEGELESWLELPGGLQEERLVITRLYQRLTFRNSQVHLFIYF